MILRYRGIVRVILPMFVIIAFVWNGASYAESIEDSGRFVVQADQVLLDTKTMLMWPLGDNGKNVSWFEAKQYCENFKGGEYDDWRMPTYDELRTLYDEDTVRIVRKIPVYFVKQIRLTNIMIWASDDKNSRAARLALDWGGKLWYKKHISDMGRVLPVRSYDQ